MPTASTGLCRCDPAALPAIRRWVADQLRSALGALTDADSTLIDDARLVVSELATNGMRAGCTRVSVSLDVTAAEVVVEVAEDAPGRPQPIECGPSSDHGRGLSLVEALSRTWGVREITSGKAVWAVLSRVGPPAAVGAARA